MAPAIWTAALVAAVLHVLFFCAESLWWERPGVMRGFQMTSEQARTTRVIAFNQGFYNLMLALGVVVGFVAWLTGREDVGFGVAAWSCLSMVVAALVLLASAPQLKRGAAVQATPALVFLILLGVHLTGA